LAGIVSAPNVVFSVANQTTETDSLFLSEVGTTTIPAVPISVAELKTSNLPSPDKVKYADM
jgi:hypothetical protein